MIKCPSIAELPSHQNGKQGWPWTVGVELSGESSIDSVVLDEDQSRLLPSFSIVIPSYNQGNYIEETIRSVLLQNYPKVELIVVDGGSDDDSVHVIKRYSRWLKKWLSESDRGQSHAINKGLRNCEGDIFNWLNSDDLLAPGALHLVALTWINNPYSIIAGQVINFDNEDNEILITPKALSLKNFIDFRSARHEGMMWHQPGTFLPREKVVEVGGVQEDLKFTMDHFLMIDLVRKCDIVTVSHVLAKFRLHEQSKTVADGFLQFRLEKVRRLREVSDVNDFIPEDEIQKEHIALLLAHASSYRKIDLKSRGLLFLEIFSVSPSLASISIIRRSSTYRFIKKMIHKARKLCSNN